MTRCSFEMAREIMEDNFFGYKEAQEQYWVHLLDCGLMGPSVDDLIRKEVPIPFSQKELKACKNTHLLVLDMGFSIQHLLTGVDCYEDFYKTTASVKWKMFSKGLLSDSTSKTFSEQMKMLNENEVLPFAREVAYLLPLYQMVRGESLLGQSGARTLRNELSGGVVVINLSPLFGPLANTPYSFGMQPMSLNIKQVEANFKHDGLGIISSKSV